MFENVHPRQITRGLRFAIDTNRGSYTISVRLYDLNFRGGSDSLVDEST